ncbi:hypothetical protein [Streptomyces alfalfae]|nr:hypothetical protein [Streptomyces alfalfae]
MKAWAGVSTATSKPLAEYDARLDRGDVKKEMTLRP